MWRSRALVIILLASTLLLTGHVAVKTPTTTPTALAGLALSPQRRVPDRPDPQVLAISIDGLSPVALRRLGPDGAPNLWRLLDEGAATLNARTQHELSVTLPNHTSMLTGRRPDRRRGGHGVTWNTDRPDTTVQGAARQEVESVFSTVHAAGGSTALFAAKTKFWLFARSWPDAIDRVTIVEDRESELVAALRRDLLDGDRGFTFLHLAGPDKAGHAHGFLGRQYVAAVRRTDTLIGKLLHAADAQAALDDLTLILSADHGGRAGLRDHSDATEPANFTVPFVVWGDDIAPADLYAINPDYRDPGVRRPSYAAPRQPVRNGNIADLATSLLGLSAVPGSQEGFTTPLVVSAD